MEWVLPEIASKFSNSSKISSILLYIIPLFSELPITSFHTAAVLGHPHGHATFPARLTLPFRSCFVQLALRAQTGTRIRGSVSSRRKPRNCLWEYPRKLHGIESFKISHGSDYLKISKKLIGSHSKCVHKSSFGSST